MFPSLHVVSPHLRLVDLLQALLQDDGAHAQGHDGADGTQLQGTYGRRKVDAAKGYCFA